MVDVKVKGGVARIFLNRPEKVNALGAVFLEKLFHSLELLKSEKDLRVIVLGGHGRAFCGGADVNELAALDASNAASFVEKIHHVCEAIRRLPVPVVARLHGAVIGAGLEIAAACDLRIAAEGTKFAMPEVRLGIPSVVEAALLPRLMGSGRAAWMVMTGEAIDARRACEWGLVEEVCPVSQLDERLVILLKNILAGERETLRVQKELLQLWDEAPLSSSIALSLQRFAQAYGSGVPGVRMAKLRKKS
jgi:enoyl-CoA hydratase/carnithine racemase